MRYFVCLRGRRTAITIFIVGFMALIAVSRVNGLLQMCNPCPDCVPPCDSPISEYCSPIIIDVSGGGFHLTSATNGVQFDMSGSGKPVQIAWTAADARNAFLALPGPNGTVTNGRELFGNFSPQAPSANPNGYLALATYDQPQNGGNGDGIIDAKDKIFSSLRLWVDSNHDGIAQANELFRLAELGVYSIGLRYQESRRVDEFGNEFRYRARINVPSQGQTSSQAGPQSYDVFLKTGSIK